MGLSLPFRGATLKAQGAPIDVIVAEQGSGWEMQVGAIMKNTKNLEDSKSFMGLIVSQEAMNVYATRNEVTALPVSVAKHQHMPPGIETKLLKNDFEWAAGKRVPVTASTQLLRCRPQPCLCSGT